MKRDPIFYKLFQQSPSALFQLLKTQPANANAYRFECVAVKEPKFEIDGVFLPPKTTEPGTVYFCEVQFQKDEVLYERFFAESSQYFYRNSEKFSDWQAVIIYPSESTEQSKVYPHRSLLNGGQVHVVYLNKLGNIRSLPIWVALMVLTTLGNKAAPVEAKNLLERSQQETPALNDAIIGIVTSIMAYKFQQLSRKDIDTMLGITLEETRVFQEAIEQGREKEAAILIFRQLKKRFGKERSEAYTEIYKKDYYRSYYPFISINYASKISKQVNKRKYSVVSKNIV